MPEMTARIRHEGKPHGPNHPLWFHGETVGSEDGQPCSSPESTVGWLCVFRQAT